MSASKFSGLRVNREQYYRNNIKLTGFKKKKFALETPQYTLSSKFFGYTSHSI